MTAGQGPIVALSGVRKAYRQGGAQQAVLHGVDLEVKRGEFLAIVGTSGSGKSTLLNIIGGLDGLFQGEAQVAGQQLEQLSDVELSRFRNRQVGFVFQQFNLLDHLTCAENVALPAVFAVDGASRDSRARAVDVLQRVGMDDRADDLPANLSGGQKQRVAIARALFNSPPLLLCDEPTGNLDKHTGQQIIDLFGQLNNEDDRTLIIVTHEARVSDAAHRIERLEDGRFLNGVAPEPQAEPAPLAGAR